MSDEKHREEEGRGMLGLQEMAFSIWPGSRRGVRFMSAIADFKSRAVYSC